MAITRRIYFSMPMGGPLTPEQQDLQWGLVEKVEDLGYTAEAFARPHGKPSLVAGKGWSTELVDQVMRRCIGVVIVGNPRWIIIDKDFEYRFPTEFCHYEGALAGTLGLPKLLIAEVDLVKRVLFDLKSGSFIPMFPRNADRTWLDTPIFQDAFTAWKTELEQRRDIFLGYCSSSLGLAKNIKSYLLLQGASALDWYTDFAPGGTILEEIQEAASRCSAGIFLFTKDDKLADPKKPAVPRDNVVFEAGFFTHAKGRERVLIVREAGSKLPADLGGNIYASLEDRSDISPIENQLTKFLKERL